MSLHQLNSPNILTNKDILLAVGKHYVNWKHTFKISEVNLTIVQVNKPNSGISKLPHLQKVSFTIIGWPWTEMLGLAAQLTASKCRKYCALDRDPWGGDRGAGHLDSWVRQRRIALGPSKALRRGPAPFPGWRRFHFPSVILSKPWWETAACGVVRL